jgi:hypothetical protein
MESLASAWRRIGEEGCKHVRHQDRNRARVTEWRPWQELNVAAFLTSGILGAHPRLLGDSYEDAMGNKYLPLIIQPIVVLSADAEAIKTIYVRALDAQAPVSPLH